MNLTSPTFFSFFPFNLVSHTFWPHIRASSWVPPDLHYPRPGYRIDQSTPFNFLSSHCDCVYHRPSSTRCLLFPPPFFTGIQGYTSRSRTEKSEVSVTYHALGGFSLSLPPGDCHIEDVAPLLTPTVQHPHTHTLTISSSPRKPQRELRRRPLQAFDFAPGAIL